MQKPVLIASSEIDRSTYGPVVNKLESRGYPVVVYCADRVMSGEDQFSLTLTDDGEVSIAYNQLSIMPERLSAAWYRKISGFELPYPEDELAKRLYINREVRHMHETIWSLYDDDLWLSSPENMRRADRKIGQMMLASELGFAVPATTVSSDWEKIKADLATGEDSKLAIKTSYGIISDHEQIKAMYTTVADSQMIERLSRGTYAFPAYYQPFLPKAREWRITAVGEDVFSAAIYTDAQARVDWRKHQTAHHVQFRKESAPDGVEEKCLQYIGRMGLRYGAFDFIESPDGEITFLECNPNGQYGWLEDELELPISDAITGVLIKIAKSNV